LKHITVYAKLYIFNLATFQIAMFDAQVQKTQVNMEAKDEQIKQMTRKLNGRYELILVVLFFNLYRDYQMK